MSPACMAAPTRARVALARLAGAAHLAPGWQALAWPLLLVPLLAAAQSPAPGRPIGQPKDTSLESNAVQTP
jgi:hypothetical protein